MIAVTLIQIPQWGTVTLLELIWTAIGGATVLFVLCMLNVVFDGFRATEKGTVERMAAGAYVRREIVRLAQGGLILGVGLYSDLQPPLVPGPGFVTPAGLILISSLYLLAILVVIQSFGDWHGRNEIIRELRRKGIDLDK